jgi:ribosomal protein S18 acetylase RimI-like enzyme
MDDDSDRQKFSDLRKEKSRKNPGEGLRILGRGASPSGIVLRMVTLDDVRTFVEAYKKSYEGLEEYAYTKNRQVKGYFKWMFSRDRDGFFIAESKSGRVLGFIMVDTNWFSPFEMEKVGEIHELIVLPEFRKRGIGKTLVSKAFEYMRARGRRIAELWVGHTNYYARKFYRKLGFEEKSSFGKWIRMSKEVGW